MNKRLSLTGQEIEFIALSLTKLQKSVENTDVGLDDLINKFQ